MSHAVIPIILSRISIANEDSPIAVFRLNNGISDQLDAFFADTYYSQQRIHSHDPKFVGLFTGDMDADRVRQKLEANLPQRPAAS